MKSAMMMMSSQKEIKMFFSRDISKFDNVQSLIWKKGTERRALIKIDIIFSHWLTDYYTKFIECILNK